MPLVEKGIKKSSGHPLNNFPRQLLIHTFLGIQSCFIGSGISSVQIYVTSRVVLDQLDCRPRRARDLERNAKRAASKRTTTRVTEQ